MGMHQRRPGRYYLSCFAALLLLAQLMLAATHVHLEGTHGTHGAWRLTLAAHGHTRLPAQPYGHHHNQCPKCWAQMVAGTLLAPPAIELHRPVVSKATAPARVGDRLAEPLPRAFRQRAPPVPHAI